MIELLPKLEEIYAQMELEARRYQESESLLCPPMCGLCCESHEVQACVFEMMPAAIYLIQKHLDEKYYTLLESKPEVCIFYDAARQAEGCCSLYTKRAAICRLFGVSRVKDKYGNPRLSICKKIKEIYPERLGNILLSSDKILLAPAMEFWHRLVLNLAPPEYAILMPINQALKEALQICCWEFPFSDPNGPDLPKAA
ncbi:MAG: YkgJ family cysteine cluster protein [Candidatus Brocadiae bacterium]|nr:YkgJ family cysteine cluster protein [Candidatus Brocadiia bacterium]